MAFSSKELLVSDRIFSKGTLRYWRMLPFLVWLADLTGELMRELTLVAPKMDDSSDMKSKMDVMLQSVMKIENGATIEGHKTIVDVAVLWDATISP
ncbi:translin-associated protein X isoform X2 [Tanacetum coccineum]